MMLLYRVIDPYMHNVAIATSLEPRSRLCRKFHRDASTWS